MDAEFSEEQELLRQSAREFLQVEAPLTLVREMLDDATGMPATLWKRMAELGWMGLSIDEAHGGAGLGLLDLVVLLEEMGRCLLPAPFLSTVAIGATAIQLGGSQPQRARWLPEIARGQVVAALAQLEEDGDWSDDGIALTGARLEGRKCFVRDAACATLFLVPIRVDGAVRIALVPADSEGLCLEPVGCIDGSRKLAHLRFDGVPLGNDALLPASVDGRPLLERVHDVAKVALAAEACGGAQSVLQMSVAYAASREQFGQPIGRFQSIQHKCADMLIDVEGIKSSNYYAAWALENDSEDAHAAACMAKVYSAEAYSRVAGQGIQIHGGLGFTWEQDLHLFYKRAKADELHLGDASWNRELVAREILDEAS